MDANDIKQKQQEEIERLSKEEEIFELEQLIIAGKDLKIPITFIYPNTDKKVGAVIKPLTSNEWDKCTKRASKFKTSFQLEIVNVGLMDINEKPIPRTLIEEMPQGTIAELYNKIAEASGVHESREDMIEATKQIMGF